MTDVQALACADWFGAVFCATRCYPCQFDECPNEPHTWGSPEDFEHAWATFQQAPGFCGCDCGRPKRKPPTVSVRPIKASSLWLGWRWSCYLCGSGTDFTQAAAITAGIKHRAFEECRFRRYAA